MEYRVLARKYRPATFAGLIGQEVLVRTLSNAVRSGRIHHAFVLTGIRGVGKTTTARIIARALNCEQGPTVTPCGECAHCRMIGEDRHVDVLEMDAASRTGVGDIRDLLETVHYAPNTARYKIYIIDEVHMLSTSAFNALLKTLEEPPPHVKFIFATTEARKIPVTILSRCQRFDLKRVEQEALAAHLGAIAQKEGMALSPAALALLAQAAEGSVRDALSLLDQAIAHHNEPGQEIGEEQVRAMLGLADRGQTIALLTRVLEGQAAEALRAFRALYEAGADPLLVLQDLLEFTHFITRIKLAPGVANDLAFSEHERTRAAALSRELAMPVLTRLWQMLLKGIGEARLAPSPAAAAEMVLVRLAYAAELPTPEEVVKTLRQPRENAAPLQAPAEKKTPELVAPQVVLAPQVPPAPRARADVPDFSALVAALEAARQPMLAGQLRQFASLVRFAAPSDETNGEVELCMKPPMPRDFALKLSQALGTATGREWKVTLSEREGAPTLAGQAEAARREQLSQAAGDPLVARVLEQFPGATLVDVKPQVA